MSSPGNSGETNSAASAKPPRTRVWDLPVRLFHWLLVIAMLVSFISGNIGGNWLEWHMYSGFIALGLVLFRIVWGVVGSYHARFVNFVRGPAATFAYLRVLVAGTSRPSVGHNPTGAMSVLAMLAVIALQAVTGLFANDDIMLEGPLASSVSKRISDLLTYVHKLNSNLLLALVALHVLAIAYYYFAKKENLLKPMVTGIKSVGDSAPSTSPPVWLPWLIAILAAASVYLIVKK